MNPFQHMKIQCKQFEAGVALQPHHAFLLDEENIHHLQHLLQMMTQHPLRHAHDELVATLKQQHFLLVKEQIQHVSCVCQWHPLFKKIKKFKKSFNLLEMVK